MTGVCLKCAHPYPPVNSAWIIFHTVDKPVSTYLPQPSTDGWPD